MDYQTLRECMLDPKEMIHMSPGYIEAMTGFILACESAGMSADYCLERLNKIYSTKYE